jgi:nucleoside-diphosphate-sugar epimerase
MVIRCLVTGASGFIGKHLVKRLDDLGCDVFTSNKIKADGSMVPHRPFDVIFHLGARTGLSSSYGDYYKDNVFDMMPLFDIPTKRFVLASTSSVYGRVATCDENGATEPISDYGITKLMQENLCKLHVKVPLVILRLFSVYGPGQRSDMMVSKFISKIKKDEPVPVYGDGEQLRGMTYIDDVIDAFTHAMVKLPPDTYNVGGPVSFSVNDVIDNLGVVSGKQIKRETLPPRPGDQESTLADTSKLRLFGWRVQSTGLLHGLRQQWEASL